MKILLTGASGFIGGRLQEALTRCRHTVVPVSRRHGVDLKTLTTPSQWLPLLAGVEVVINAAGIIGETRGQSFDVLHRQAPQALFEACAAAGVSRVVQISALGADDQAFSAYHLSKRAADDLLRSGPLGWFVLRPSLVDGEGGASSALFRRLARLPLIPVIGNGHQQVQPVRLDDLVATLMRCLSAPKARQTIDVVGPEAFTFLDWLQRLRAAQGLPPGRVLHVPLAVAQGLTSLGQPFSPLLRGDNLRMLQAGNVGDVSPLVDFLGRMPEPVLATALDNPSRQGDRT
ncbi:MAG: hypothetical protein RL375_4851 [Pseudomonadota bacterium]